MNFILAALTFLSLPVCTLEKNIVVEKQEFEKPTTSKNTETTKFKKVPTKWVKITKKSN